MARRAIICPVASRFVVFSVAGRRYALPVERVREVVEWKEPRALGAPEPWLLGVIAQRGELLQVCDLALRLGLEPGPRSRIVVFDVSGGRAGLAIDAVETVVSVEDARVSPAPSGSGDVVAGIAHLNSDLVVVLDADSLLGPKPAAPARRRRTNRPRRRAVD